LEISYLNPLVSLCRLACAHSPISALMS
jgi:hypothetical protein